MVIPVKFTNQISKLDITFVENKETFSPIIRTAKSYEQIGYDKGHEAGYEKGQTDYEKDKLPGKQKEFIKNFFSRGFYQSTDGYCFPNFFSGTSWDVKAFKDFLGYYGITETLTAATANQSRCFRNFIGTDLGGIKLDLSQATTLQEAFYNCKITVLPTIDLTGLTPVNNNIGEVSANIFSSGHLQRIEKLVVGPNFKNLHSTTFTNASNLTAIEEIDGTFASNIYFKGCKSLDVDTLIRIANSLAKVTDTQYTIYFHIDIINKLNSNKYNINDPDPNSPTIADYINNEKGWIILEVK